MPGKPRKRKMTCKTLEETARALYYVHEICPPQFNCGSYADLSNKILDFMKEMKCRVK